MLIPSALFLCGWWGLAASFEDVPLDGAASGGGWWGTAGLRLFALVPMILAGLFAWMVWSRRERLERTVGVVEVCAADSYRGVGLMTGGCSSRRVSSSNTRHCSSYIRYCSLHFSFSASLT